MIINRNVSYEQLRKNKSKQSASWDIWNHCFDLILFCVFFPAGLLFCFHNIIWLCVTHCSMLLVSFRMWTFNHVSPSYKVPAACTSPTLLCLNTCFCLPPKFTLFSCQPRSWWLRKTFILLLPLLRTATHLSSSTYRLRQDLKIQAWS